MIPRTAVWKHALANSVRDPAELLTLLDLSTDLLPPTRAAAQQYPLRVPRGYLARIRKGDINDPLLRQIMPLRQELENIAGFGTDPVGDSMATVAPGVLHKYHGRILLTTTGACAIHCRYCFRRHFPYGAENPTRHNWQKTIDYMQTHPELEELILSGGDPLILDTDQLRQLTSRLMELPQLKRLRLHSRLPIVLPERIDADLLDWLRQLPWQVVVVVHCNHPNEIDTSVAQALTLLDRHTILFNQSVLLRGINDNTATLRQLHEDLFLHRVMPYYLHLPDRTSGSAHFEVSEKRALQILAELRRQLPGYLLPQLVREVAGEPHKLPLSGS